jgi:D-alanine-D-alanine ligase
MSETAFATASPSVESSVQERSRPIGVLMGGSSAERRISLYTGAHVLAALIERGYDATPIDWRNGFSLAALLREARVGRVWVALHGTLGEDGCVQGLLESERIPYTGSGVLASALGMNKIASKQLFDRLEIPTPDWTRYRSDGDAGSLGFPLVVKPSQQGSSVGVSLVREESELPEAIGTARRFSGDVLLERFVPGRELSVGVLDDEVLGTVEIKPGGDLFDWNAKYDLANHRTEYVLPAPLDPATDARVRALALSAHRALGCSGLSRTDMRLQDDGRAFVLEVNTLPGCGTLSLVTKIAHHAGLSYGDLVERVLLGARLHA